MSRGNKEMTQTPAHDTLPCTMNICMCVHCMKFIFLIESPYASLRFWVRPEQLES